MNITKSENNTYNQIDRTNHRTLRLNQHTALPNNKSSQNIAEDNTLSAKSLNKFAAENGQINEEELSATVTAHLLSDSPELSAAFTSQYQTLVASGVSAEDATKQSLAALVEGGGISESVAEKINGLAFRAAQLDNNLTALFDSRGGAGDDTVATASIQKALASALSTLEGIKSGEITASNRPLSEASNIAPSSGVSSSGSTGAASFANGEFLWKPISESNGKLVVLLPSTLTGQVVSAGIYSDKPEAGGRLIESGDFAGDTHNGGRAHFRFDKSGGNYPDGSYVIAQLRSGQTVGFQIADSSSRNTA